MRNMKNTVVNVKRLLGRAFNDALAAAELKRVPYRAVEAGASVVLSFLLCRSAIRFSSSVFDFACFLAWLWRSFALPLAAAAARFCACVIKKTRRLSSAGRATCARRAKREN